MKWVFDSSSLIYLGKAGLLKILDALPGEKIIPSKVYEEVVQQGAERGDREVHEIQILIETKEFSVESGKDDIVNVFSAIPRLSDADKEVLVLAKEKKGIAVIDEMQARIAAERFGISYHGLLYLILELLRKKKITKKEALILLDTMIAFGFYLSTAKYQEFLKIINDVV